VQPGYPQQQPYQPQYGGPQYGGQPYAQPYGQQYGQQQPVYPQQYPPQSHYPPQPPPPVYRPTPPRGSRVPRVIASVIVLILLAAGGFALWNSLANGAGSANVGDCLKATGPGPKTTEFAKADCAAPDAAYKYAVKSDQGCPSISYGYNTEKSGRYSRYRQCLMLNAKQGDCFKQSVGFPTGQAEKVACSAGATYRVTKVVEATADASACGRNADSDATGDDWTHPRALVYKEPPTTVCTDAPR
jgi:hypothetical protein